MSRSAGLLLVAALAVAGSLAVAALRGPPPAASLEDRVRAVASTLRCPVCESLSVADSPSGLAAEMRRTIARRLVRGDSAAEIRQDFVRAYGEWILMAPPPRGINLVAWLAPFAALLGGGALVILALRRWRRAEDHASGRAPPPVGAGLRGSSRGASGTPLGMDEWEGEVEVGRDRFLQVLRETRDALDARGVRYLFLGGVASQALGRPRWTHDADVIVAPEEAAAALEALGAAGFRTQRTDPRWLFKALKDHVLVDLVFRSQGIGDHLPVTLDGRMLERATEEDVEGVALRVVPPEDLVIIKALVWKEHTPRHWHDALAVLRRPDIDWEYLGERARRHDPLRVLSLLLYAESNDTPVPWSLVSDLYREGMRWTPTATSPST